MPVPWVFPRYGTYGDYGRFITTVPWRLVLHTPEIPWAYDIERTAAIIQRGKPKAVYTVLANTKRRRVLQLGALDRMDGSLKNQAGGVETNRARVIAVSICGYARDMHLLPDEELDWLATDVLVPIVRAGYPVDLSRYRVFGGSETYGADKPTRMTFAEWSEFNGICGHQNVPENDHWDPGRLNVARVSQTAVRVLGTLEGAGGGGLDVNSDEKLDWIMQRLGFANDPAPYKGNGWDLQQRAERLDRAVTNGGNPGTPPLVAQIVNAMPKPLTAEEITDAVREALPADASGVTAAELERIVERVVTGVMNRTTSAGHFTVDPSP